MRRHHPIRILASAVVFIAACGGGELASLPASTASTTTSISSPTEPMGSVTTTTDKPEVSVGSLPATTITTADTPTSTPEPPTGTTSEPSGIIQVPEAFLSGVIEDAASRQNVEVVAVTVLSGRPVDWHDGSLGCPEPNKFYVQVITPGYLVLVDAGGVTLEYHLNQHGGFKQCTGGIFHPPSDY